MRFVLDERKSIVGFITESALGRTATEKALDHLRDNSPGGDGPYRGGVPDRFARPGA